MATGIIGILNGSATLTYIPASNAKILIFANNGTSTFTVNGYPIAFNGASVNLTMYVGANQTVTIASGASAWGFISAIEENS